MADTAHYLTDKELEKMERHLSSIYSRANNEIGETWKAYLAEVEKEIKSLQDAYDAAKLSGDKTTIRKAGRELSAKKREKTILDTHYRNLTKQLAGELSRVNETAVAYINGRLPNVYALNYNATANGVETAVKGYSFELVDASTVKNLATSDKTLLPYKHVDGQKDVRWNTTKVNSEVLQGILQGESIPKIANRLSKVVGMNEASAIRNARTTVTSAENKGRMDMLHDAADKGVITHKVWMATHDSRVREAHADLDGQEQEIDEPFESELGPIMYPGDVDADPANTYNCRCTLTYKVVGFGEQESFAEKYEAYMPNNINFLPDSTVEDVKYAVANMKGAEGDAWKEIIDNAKVVGGDSNFFDPQNRTVTLNQDEADARAVFHELAHSIDVGGVNVSLDEWTNLNNVSELLDELTHRAVFDGALDDLDTLCQYIGLDLQSDDAGKEFLGWIKEIKQNYGDGNAAIISDLVDGFTSGDLESFTMLYGFHGKDYWMTQYGGGSGSLLSQEAWAHYCSLRATGQNEMLGLLDKMTPNLSEALKFAYHEVFEA